MSAAPAELPPRGLVGLDPAWSRIVHCPDHVGIDRSWHLLDNAVENARLTIVCFHGNPTWSYVWRDLIARAADDVRVVAFDHLDMGFSERTGRLRRLADRVDDAASLISMLDLSTPIVTVAHDWGGPISLGWAQQHIDRLAGVVLSNTAVHQPSDQSPPAVIRAVRSAPLLRRATVDTNAFLIGALALTSPRLPPEVRSAYVAPYRSAERRCAIGDFVEDIPLEPSHPSHTALEAIAEDMEALADVPALLLWGPKDPVFGDRYLHDLERRLPHADVHRFVDSGHLVPEEADVAGAVHRWIDRAERPRRAGARRRRGMCAAIDDLADSSKIAVCERTAGRLETLTFAQMARRVETLASGLAVHGVRPGDRVALMIPPGIDLTTVVYACFRLGAVGVLVDAGLGPRNMSRALASADPAHLIGIDRALLARRALGWPGEPIAVGALDPLRQRLLGVSVTIADLLARGAASPGSVSEPNPDGNADAAVVFTSGSTGPSKGVVYTSGQLQAQRDLIASTYGIGRDDRLVAAFAPFALYGPALGITSIVPDMDVTEPSSLTAQELAESIDAIDATMVFASPAALANVIETAAGLDDASRAGLGRPRLVLSAGAPINPTMLRRATEVLTSAHAHTPYGMTEVLPVADISLDLLEELATSPIDSAPSGSAVTRGSCVGFPLPGVDVRVEPFATEATDPGESIGRSSAAMGEILVRAEHLKDRYDRLWYTDDRSTTVDGWHRTGDVGSLDGDGRLWVGGRLGDVITTAAGPVLPVPIEQAAESVPEIGRAAAIGVGPPGRQVVAVVAEATGRPDPTVADADLTKAVRTAVAEAAAVDIVALLVGVDLPVDRRHNAKIDRSRLAAWAGDLLAGARMTQP